MRNLFTVILWGEDYVQPFLRACLPTLLSPGNLGGEARERGSRFLIVTTRQDAARIRTSPIFAALQNHIEVEFLIISRPGGANKYAALSRQQMKAIRRSAAFDTIFFLYPDFVFSDGTIGRALKRLASGYEAVALPIPRVVEERLVPELARFGIPGQPGIAIPPTAFTELATRCLHPSHSSYTWANPEMSEYPSTLLWEAPNGGMLFRCFHLHPLAMRVQHHRETYNAQFRVSLDEEYFPRVFPDSNGVYCIPDSHEGAVCSLSPGSFRVSRIPSWQKPNVLFLARWAESATSTLHRQFVTHAYRWCCGPVNTESWQAVEQASQDNVQPILDRLTISSQLLRIEDPFSYRQRQRRLRRFSYWRRSLLRVPLRINDISTKNLFAVILARVVWRALLATRLITIGRRLWSLFRLGQGRTLDELKEGGGLASFVRMTHGVSLTALGIELVRRMFCWR